MWDAFSANTGQPPRPYLTITNVTSGSSSRRGAINFGPNGEILAYYLSSGTAGNWLSMWNSTKAILGPGAVGSMSIWNPAYGSTVNGERGIQWNVTLPSFGQTIALMEGQRRIHFGFKRFRDFANLWTNANGVSSFIAAEPRWNLSNNA